MLQHCKRLVNNDHYGKAPWHGQLGTKTTCVNLNSFFQSHFWWMIQLSRFFHCEICTQMKCLGDSFLPSHCPRILAMSPVRKSAFSAFGSCMGPWVSEKVPVVAAMTVSLSLNESWLSQSQSQWVSIVSVSIFLCLTHRQNVSQKLCFSHVETLIRVSQDCRGWIPFAFLRWFTVISFLLVSIVLRESNESRRVRRVSWTDGPSN